MIWCDIFLLLRFFFSRQFSSYLILPDDQSVHVHGNANAQFMVWTRTKISFESDCLPTKCMCCLISSQFIRIWNTEIKYICYCCCCCYSSFVGRTRTIQQPESNAAEDLEKYDRIRAIKRSRREKQKKNNQQQQQQNTQIARCWQTHYIKNEPHIARANYSNLRWSTNCLAAVAWNSTMQSNSNTHHGFKLR